MLGNPDFEQNYWSEAEGNYKIRHVSVKLWKWLICYNRFYHDNLNYLDLMGSSCKYLK